MKMSTPRSNGIVMVGGSGGGGGGTNAISTHEKDLEKFIKYLAYKAIQVVVQSRLGEKLETKCNPLASGSDWFNLVIVDHQDVSQEIKRALALSPSESILHRLPLCVEISLQTTEGDRMVLEVWSLDVQGASAKLDIAHKDIDKIEQQQQQQQQTKSGENGTGTPNSAAIYNRMGVLLKSVISLTRATPAYKLSRRQCADSYGIYYRIYVDRPQMHTLGEGHKHARIGLLQTAIGTISMSVAYRTKMTITPTTVVRGRHNGTTTITGGDHGTGGVNGVGNGIMLKSDHFRPHDAQSPKTQQQQQQIQQNDCLGMAITANGGDFAGKNGAMEFVDIEKPLRPGAFTDLAKLHQYTEKDFVLPETPPFEWLLLRRRTRCESGGSTGGSIESINRKSESPPVAAVVASPLGNGHQHNINNNTANGHLQNNNNNNNNNNIAAFKSLENDENALMMTGQTTTPLLTTLIGKTSPSPSQSPSQTSLSQSPIKSLLIPASAGRNSTAPILHVGSTSTPPNSLNDDDDSLLKELNIAFASPTSHVNDLAKFYRDCYHAPPLSGLGELRTSDETANVDETSSKNTNNGISTINNTNNINDCSSIESSVESSVMSNDDLSRQLEQFETSLEDYDKLVSQFGLTTSTTSTTGSRSSGGLQMSN